MRMWLGLLVATSLACDADGGGEGTDEELPSPYADDDEQEPQAEPPSLTPEQVSSAAMAGMQAFVSLEPDGVIDAFEALAQFEPECPEEQEVAGEGENVALLWYSEGCTTSTGLEIRGGGRFERFARDEDGRMTTGAALSAEGSNLRLSTSDGRFFEMTGYVYYERGVSDEGADSVFEVAGDILADSTTAAASPLMDGSVSAQGYLFSFAGGPYVALGGSGSISGAVLGEARAFQFTDLFVVPTGCAREPVGIVSVRDDAGYWHDVVFDVATVVEDEEPQFDAALCDGCGTYVVGGNTQEQACVAESELSALMQWEEYPW